MNKKSVQIFNITKTAALPTESMTQSSDGDDEDDDDDDETDAKTNGAGATRHIKWSKRVKKKSAQSAMRKDTNKQTTLDAKHETGDKKTRSSSNLPRTIMDESRYYCFCNTHVLVGAKVIGYAGAILSTFFLLSALMRFSVEGAFVSTVLICVYSTAICAHRKHNANYYIPFLIVNGAGLVLNLLYIVFLGVMFAWMPAFWQQELKPTIVENKERNNHYLYDETKDDYDTQEMVLLDVAYVTTGIILVMMTIMAVLFIWFESIVYRSYCYMTEKHTHLIKPDVFIK